MKRICYISILIASGLMSLSGSSLATTVSVKVTVSEDNCRINENRSVTAEFGTVDVSKLTQATASVPVTIVCDRVPSGTVSLAIKGTPSVFDGESLKTDVPGLGVSLSSKQAGQLDLNTFYDVSKDLGLTSKIGVVDLTARLTSDGKTELAGGEFNASATLIMQVS